MGFNILVGVASYAIAEEKLEDRYKQLRSTHFIIFYDSQIDKNYASKIKDTAEKFYRVITQEFGLIRDKLWLWESRTKVFIAKDKSDYLNYFLVRIGRQLALIIGKE